MAQFHWSDVNDCDFIVIAMDHFQETESNHGVIKIGIHHHCNDKMMHQFENNPILKIKKY